LKEAGLISKDQSKEKEHRTRTNKFNLPMKKITIICVMALLCPRKLKAERPKLKAYLLITLLVCLFSGQLLAQDIQPLKLGDKLPETFWQQDYAFYKDGKTVTENLTAYKGKLLILDFWATWCSTCYHKFNYLDSLAKVRGESLGVIMVNTVNTGDKLDKIKGSLNKFTEGKDFGLASIYNDQYLVKLFPHAMLSHYVWINKLGIVVAITGSDFINDNNINLSVARFEKH
jgi:thiol-disulfide isomerase/thioredoxin